MFNTIPFLTIATLTLSLVMLGCSDDDLQNVNETSTQGTQSSENTHTAGHGGAVIPLGNTTIGTFQVMATRDEGLIVAGKDSPIDVTVTPVSGSSITAVAVRFWIGTESAVGSMKAKSEIENPAEPNRWHTHADVPNPIPAESMLWVEIETDNGEKVTGSFDLKTD